MIPIFFKIKILAQEGILKKISYECRGYESVDDKSILQVNYIPKTNEKEFGQWKVNLLSKVSAI